MPIQLDGTCNGFQHLAMLSNETKLFEALNLSKASRKDDPKDLYQVLVDQVNLRIELKLNDDSINKPENIELLSTYKSLLAAKLNRKILKPAVMNHPYNATARTLVQYIKDLLIFVKSDEVKVIKDDEIKTYIRGWYSISQNETDNLINHRDIEILVDIIIEIIYIKYPKIKELNNYLRGMVVVLNKLGLPIIWKIPNGLKVSQNYLVTKSKNVKPYTYLKNSITLTTTIKDSIDKPKQITAFMPNLVHSLDSSTLILLYQAFYNTINEKGGVVNFYSVHDCYGITAKHVDLLINILRSIYIEIYSNEIFIKKFDKDIIKLIKDSYGNGIFCEKDRIFTIECVKYKLPSISKLIENRDELAYQDLLNSKYLIK